VADRAPGSGQIELASDETALATLAGLLDDFDPNFNIVTPLIGSVRPPSATFIYAGSPWCGPRRRVKRGRNTTPRWVAGA
jgi:hypothetical protein